MKLITRIRKAECIKKAQIWNDLDVSFADKLDLVKEMVLSLPKGTYRLKKRGAGTNIVDSVSERYGWMPSMLVSEPLLFGMSVGNPKKVRAVFTHGLDTLELL